MKFFTFINEKNNKKIKVFNFSLFDVSVDKETKSTTQKFFGKLLTTKKNVNEVGTEIVKTIYFLNMPVIIEKAIYDEKFSYLFNICIKKKSLLEKYKKIYSQPIYDKYDSLFFLRANLGEIYLLFTYFFEVFCKKNNIKNPLVITEKKYHIEVIKNIFPDIDCIYQETNAGEIKNFYNKISNHDCYTFYTLEHFKKVEQDNIDYFSLITKDTNISKEELSYKKLNITDDIKKSLKNKIKEINLNTDNFIFILPEAASCEQVDSGLWYNIIKAYNDANVDVFTNLANDTFKIEDCHYKTCQLTLLEAFELARMSKKVIGLRNGFLDLLTQTDAKMDIIYTGFKDRPAFKKISADKVYSNFSFKNLPFIKMKNINEYKITDYTQEQLLDIITKDAINFTN